MCSVVTLLSYFDLGLHTLVAKVSCDQATLVICLDLPDFLIDFLAIPPPSRNRVVWNLRTIYKYYPLVCQLPRKVMKTNRTFAVYSGCDYSIEMLTVVRRQTASALACRIG